MYYLDPSPYPIILRVLWAANYHLGSYNEELLSITFRKQPLLDEVTAQAHYHRFSIGREYRMKSNHNFLH